MKASLLFPLTALFACGLAFRPAPAEPELKAAAQQLNDAVKIVLEQSGLTPVPERKRLGSAITIDTYSIAYKGCAEPASVVPITFENIDMAFYVATALSPAQPGMRQTIHFIEKSWDGFDRYGLQWSRLLHAIKVRLGDNRHTSMNALVLVSRARDCTEPSNIEWAKVWEPRHLIHSADNAHGLPR